MARAQGAREGRKMIERLAQAFAAYGKPDWEVLARIALRTMRQPTPKMCKAACKAMSPEKRPTKRHVSNKAKHAIRYRAMIDAEMPHSSPVSD